MDLKTLAGLALADSTFTCKDAAVGRSYKTLLQAKSSLLPNECLKLAWIFTKNMPEELNVKKNLEGDIPRSFHRNAETGEVAISLKRDGLIAKTKVKKVSRALLYSPQKATIIAQLTTRDRCEKIEVEVTRREYKIAQALKGKPGVWTILFMAEYKKNGTEKVKLLEPIGETFYDVALTLSFEELVEKTDILLQGLEEMHKDDYFHGDVKVINALDSDTCTGWCDFGHVGKITDERFKRGLYGTMECTAPEFFGVRGKEQDKRELDMFAMGTAMWWAYFKCHPPFMRKDNFPQDSDLPITETDKIRYKKAVLEAIEGPYNTLKKKKQLTKKEHYELLIYTLLSPPEIRPTATKAREELKKCRR